MFYPQLKQCCCCIPLRVGALIIGWTSLIGASVGIVVENDIIGGASAEGIQSNSPLQIIAYFIGFFLAALLLTGVYQKKTQYLDFWVSSSTFGIVLFDIVNLILFFVGEDPTFALANILGSFVQIYFILVVNSHAQEIKEYVEPAEPDV